MEKERKKTMAQTLKLKRGNSANFGSLTLAAGEPAFVLDTGKLYVGDGTAKLLKVNIIIRPKYSLLKKSLVFSSGICYNGTQFRGNALIASC